MAIGGVLGSLSRYLIAEKTNKYEAAIFLANLLGVFIAGIVTYRLKPNEYQELFWVTGFAGGFTTFSSVAVIYSNSSGIKGFLYFFETVLLSLVVLRLIQRRVRG